MAISTIWRSAKERSAQRRAGMHVEMDLLQLHGRGLVHARLGDQAVAQEFLLAAQKDVLGHRQRRQDRLFLEHHGDAGVEGVARRGDLDLPCH